MTKYAEQLKAARATVTNILGEARDTKFRGQVSVTFSFSDGGVRRTSLDVAVGGDSLRVVMDDFMAVQKVVRREKKQSMEEMG